MSSKTLRGGGRSRRSYMLTDLQNSSHFNPSTGDTAACLLSHTLRESQSLFNYCRSRAGNEVLVHECITGGDLDMHFEAYQGSLGNGPARRLLVSCMSWYHGMLLTQHSTAQQSLVILGFAALEPWMYVLLCHPALVISRHEEIVSRAT